MKVLKVSKRDINKVLKETIRAVKGGQVIICPTDTVYGLLCDAINKEAVNKLFKIKKRQPDKPVPIFIRDIKMAKKLAHINKEQEKFIKNVWPGKVTVVLKTKKEKKTIGLRVPDYKFINQILIKINKPLTGTSANISGQPASTKIKEVLKQFKKQKYQPDLVLDAGNLKKSKPSTVINLTIWPPKVIRF